MIVSDQQTRPPDNPPPGDEWKPIPGAGYYEASHRGKVRSVDRKIKGQFYTSKELAQRLGNKPKPGDTVQYMMTNVRRDDGTVWTNTVHTFVLLAHAGEPEPGQECCHGPGGPLDNRYPENIRWDTKAANEAEKWRPPKAEPKPPPRCINYDRCGQLAGKGGRRCHPCVVEVGRAGALLLANDVDPEKAAQELDYASSIGLIRLAKKYGGLRLLLDDAAPDVTQRYRQPLASRLRRVIFRREASHGNSDAQ